MYQRFSFSRFFLILLYLFGATFVSCKEPPQAAVANATPHNYSVIVVDAITQAAIVNAKVTISKSNLSGVPVSIRTDDNGVAAFNHLNEEDTDTLIQIIVEANGYKRHTSFITVQLDSLPTEIQLDLSPTSTPTIEALSCQGEVLIIARQTTIMSGETVFLTANANGRLSEFEWEADRGGFNRTDGQFVEYTAPIEPGIAKITVTAKEQNCSGPKMDTLEFEVLKPTSTATQTVTSTSVAMPTENATSTATVGPSAILSPVPRTPTQVINGHVMLREPKNNTCVGERIVFEWDYFRSLNSVEGEGGEYFALNLWDPQAQMIRSVSWIKEPRFEIENLTLPVAVYTNLINCNQDAGCRWSVDVIRSNVARGDGWRPEAFDTIAISNEIRNFCVTSGSPQIPPTDTPLPPTPTNTRPPLP